MFGAETHTGIFPGRCGNETINHSIIGHLPSLWYFPRHFHFSHFSLLTVLNRLTMEDKVKCDSHPLPDEKWGGKRAVIYSMSVEFNTNILVWSKTRGSRKKVALKKHISSALCSVMRMEWYLNVNERPFYNGTYYLSKWQYSESLWRFSGNIGSARHKQTMMAYRSALHDISLSLRC